MQLQRRVGRDVHLHAVGLVALELERDLVAPRRDVEALEETVEVVHRPRVVAVHVDARLGGVHEHADRPALALDVVVDRAAAAPAPGIAVVAAVVAAVPARRSRRATRSPSSRGSTRRRPSPGSPGSRDSSRRRPSRYRSPRGGAGARRSRAGRARARARAPAVAGARAGAAAAGADARRGMAPPPPEDPPPPPPPRGTAWSCARRAGASARLAARIRIVGRAVIVASVVVRQPSPVTMQRACPTARSTRRCR